MGKRGESSQQQKNGTSLALKGLVNHRALHSVVLVAVLLLAAYTAFFRLGVGDWHTDEVTYRNAGLMYVQDHDFSRNREHPFLAKYVLGVTQVVFDSSEPWVVRFPAAVACLLTGLILFTFARRVAGFWTGILTLTLWVISPVISKYGRLALLESFLAFFSTLALYLGWRWAETGTWRFAAFAGVAIGLATASKAVGILFLPPILFAGLLKIGISWRFVFQSLLIGLAAAAVALATYAPLGSEVPSAIQYMFHFHSVHNAEGRGAVINGVWYQFHPWWKHLWAQWDFYGTLATLSLGAAVVIALLRPRPVKLYLLAATLVPFLFLSFYVSFKLPHYVYTWQPPLILLLALAAGKLARQGIIGGIFTVLLLAPFAYLGVETVKAVSHTQPGYYAAVAEHLEATGHDRDTMLVWGWRNVVEAYLPEAQVLKDREHAQGEEIEAVIVDRSYAKRKPNRSVESYLATNSEKFEPSYSVKEIEVYTRKSDR